MEVNIQNTYAHTESDHYVFCHKIHEQGGAFKFTQHSNQHHFLLYKDEDGCKGVCGGMSNLFAFSDVRFNNTAALRFAESLSLRLNHMLKQCRELLPLTPDEVASGGYIFHPVQTFFPLQYAGCDLIVL